MTDIVVPTWQYHDQNVQSGISTSNFTRGDRTVIYTAPTPQAGQTNQNPMKAIGFIQGVSHSEQKQLQIIYELGSSLPMIIPGLTQGQLNLSRVLLSGLDFLNAIYQGPDVTTLSNDQILRSIRDVNAPFDLMLAKYPVLENGTSVAPTALSTILFRGCQMQSRAESINSDGVVVMEQISILYASIPKVTFKTS